MTKNAIHYIQENGVSGFMHELMYRATTIYYERHLGVDTRGYINPEDLGFANTEFHAYATIGHKAIFSMLERIPLKKSESTFIDYGCGKGRAVVVAATFPFRRVIGIELSAPLLEAARNNVKKMRHKLAECIELYQLDATQYVLPKDVNIIYFFNPFKGQILQDVVNNIHDSYKKYPRKIYILYVNNSFFEKIIADQNWITRIYETSFYPIHSCGLYVTG
jgi:SAM-dependent methyltransferase